jgi:hypothetical protein
VWDKKGFEAGIIHGGRGKQLGVQVLGIVVILAWVCLTIGPTFLVLKYFKVLRLSTELQLSVHVRSSQHSTLKYSAPTLASTEAVPTVTFLMCVCHVQGSGTMSILVQLMFLTRAFTALCMSDEWNKGLTLFSRPASCLGSATQVGLVSRDSC